jgi:hypothetical protein
MRLLKYCILIFSQLIPFLINAQTDSTYQNEVAFIHHLIDRKKFDDAIFVANAALLKFQQDEQTDSLRYLKAWSFYNQKKLDSSATNFLFIAPKSPVFAKARFFATYNLAHCRKYAEATEIISTFETKDTLLTEFKKFQRAGLNLLTRNFSAFDAESLQFSGKYYAFANEEIKLNELKKQLTNYRPRKAWKAALLSAIIPGGGKWMVGKKGEAASAFFVVGGLAAATAESFRKSGPRNFRTILAGTGFLFFYSGNIIGSAYAAQSQNKLFYDSIDQNILFNLHVPLRTLFN